VCCVSVCEFTPLPTLSNCKAELEGLPRLRASVSLAAFPRFLHLHHTKHTCIMQGWCLTYLVCLLLGTGKIIEQPCLLDSFSLWISYFLELLLTPFLQQVRCAWYMSMQTMKDSNWIKHINSNMYHVQKTCILHIPFENRWSISSFYAWVGSLMHSNCPPFPFYSNRLFNYSVLFTWLRRGMCI
jgi:hypothetical protein